MRAVIMLATLAVFVSWFFTARGVINSDVLLYACDQGSHGAASDAQKASNSVIEYVNQHASDPGYNVQYNVRIGDDTYYGHAACDGTITKEDCNTCAGVAYQDLLELCVIGVNGGFVKLASCRIRFADHTFDQNY